MRDQIKHRLEDSAKDNGRSLSEEIESRLEQSFLMTEEFFGGRRTFILMRMMADMFQIAETRSGKRWDDWNLTAFCGFICGIFPEVEVDTTRLGNAQRFLLCHITLHTELVNSSTGKHVPYQPVSHSRQQLTSIFFTLKYQCKHTGT